jgi:hypothetical protein
MPSRSTWFSWRMSLCAALAALFFFVAIDIREAEPFPDYAFVIAPILLISGISLFIYAAIGKNRRRALRLLSILAIVWIIGTACYAYAQEIRSTARWLIRSGDYKAQVLAQPQPPNGELKHIEWDELGMFAQDWTVFLVFDPTDSLSRPARSGQSGKFNGIPCEVVRVHRMESHWYTVLFFGYVHASSWDSCN